MIGLRVKIKAEYVYRYGDYLYAKEGIVRHVVGDRCSVEFGFPDGFSRWVETRHLTKEI